MSSRIQLAGVGQVFQVRSDTDEQIEEFVAARRPRPHRGGRRVRHPRRPEWLRQVHAARPARRADPAHVGRDPASTASAVTGPGPRPRASSSSSTRCCRGAPRWATSSSPWRPRAACRKAERARAAPSYLELVGLTELRRPLPARALRRHEAAGGDRPQPRLRARGAADGRAVRRRSTPRPASRCRTSCCGSGSAPARPSSSSPTASTRRSTWASGSR